MRHTNWCGFAVGGLTWLAVVASAAAQGDGKTPQQRAALAERQVAVKEAAVKIAEAKIGVAEAKVNVAKAGLEAAKAPVVRWEADVKRIKQLHAQGGVDAATVDETQLKLASARASLAEAQGKLQLAESEMAVEAARRQLAQAELSEAQLRRDQIGDKTPQAPKKDDGLQALLKTKLDLAKKGYADSLPGVTEIKRVEKITISVVKPVEVYTWSVHWLKAERDMSDKKEGHIAALEAHLKRVKDLEIRVKKLVPELLPQSDATAAFWVAEAEVWLAKEKAK